MLCSRRMGPLMAGAAVLLVLLSLRAGMPAPFERLRLAGFDTLQRLSPSRWGDAPVIVVDVDDDTLLRHGQWPWPRTLVADLVRALQDLDASAVALDMVFAEPDRTSPSRLVPEWERRFGFRPSGSRHAAAGSRRGAGGGLRTRPGDRRLRPASAGQRGHARPSRRHRVHRRRPAPVGSAVCRHDRQHRVSGPGGLGARQLHGLGGQRRDHPAPSAHHDGRRKPRPLARARRPARHAGRGHDQGAGRARRRDADRIHDPHRRGRHSPRRHGRAVAALPAGPLDAQRRGLAPARSDRARGSARRGPGQGGVRRHQRHWPVGPAAHADDPLRARSEPPRHRAGAGAHRPSPDPPGLGAGPRDARGDGVGSCCRLMRGVHTPADRHRRRSRAPPGPGAGCLGAVLEGRSAPRPDVSRTVRRIGLRRGGPGALREHRARGAAAPVRLHALPLARSRRGVGERPRTAQARRRSSRHDLPVHRPRRVHGDDRDDGRGRRSSICSTAISTGCAPSRWNTAGPWTRSWAMPST